MAPHNMKVKIHMFKAAHNCSIHRILKLKIRKMALFSKANFQ